MIQIPRNATLAEALYRDIDKDAYLQEIYGDLLYNYSLNPQNKPSKKPTQRAKNIV